LIVETRENKRTMSIIGPSRRTPAASPPPSTADSAPGVGPGLGLGVRPGAGEGIHVKGEIQSCTTLVVEGRVEASLEAAELAVHEGGLYDGKAVVETARIGGVFTGDLTVRGLLTVAAGGRVSGSLRYRELRIEQGGRLSGDVDLLEEEEAAPGKRDTREAAKAAVSKAQAEGRAKAETDAELELTINKGRDEGYSHGDGYGHVAFVVDDLEAEHARFEAEGFEPQKLVEFRDGDALIAKFFFVTDPDGYKIEVLQRHGHYQ